MPRDSPAVFVASRRSRRSPVTALSPPGRAPYLDPRFASASALVRSLVGLDATDATDLIGRSPAAAAALVGLWDDLERIDALVPSDEADVLRDILRSTSDVAVLGVEPIAVLLIDDDDGRYLRGRRKQALRTNLRAANTRGCTAFTVPPGIGRTEWNSCARLQMPPNPWAGVEDWPIGATDNHIAVAAVDADGALVGLTVARRFGSWAVLEMAFRFGADPDGSLSRYLVHAALLDALRSVGVRHLAGGGAMRLADGLQYLQYLLGYEPMHVTVRAFDDERAIARDTPPPPPDSPPDRPSPGAADAESKRVTDDDAPSRRRQRRAWSLGVALALGGLGFAATRRRWAANAKPTRS